MAKSRLTPRENFLRLTRGEVPEYVPIYTMGFPGYNSETACRFIGPSPLNETHILPMPSGSRRDIWGVNYISNEETNFASIPEPNNFILKDITKWRDVIKKPELGDIDWEKMAKKDREEADFDPAQSAAVALIGLMPFQQFIAFMGFTEGLMALYEEPECVTELLHFMTDAYMPVIQATVDYYEPDMLYLLDDTATNYNPFISPEMFREILVPVYRRILQPAADRGIPVQYHNCGRCEDFLDDMVELGVRIWDPAQTENDLDGIKKEFAGKLAIAGGYKWSPPSTWPDVSETEIRQTVRDNIDRFAPGGGFAFFGAALGSYGDETIPKVNEWISSEAYNYGRDYYLK